MIRGLGHDSDCRNDRGKDAGPALIVGHADAGKSHAALLGDIPGR